MQLNQECIRDLLLYVEQHQPVRATGIVQPFKVKTFFTDDDAPRYSNADVAIAIQYLNDKKLIISPNPNSGTAHIQITHITAKGYDYLGLIREQSAWSALKKQFGKVFELSGPVVVEALLKGALSHFGAKF